MSNTIDCKQAKSFVKQFQNDNFYVLDKKGNFIEIGDGCFNNPCFKKYTKTELIGKCLWDMPDCKKSQFYENAQIVLKTHQSIHFEQQSFSDPDCHLMIHMFPLNQGILIYSFDVSSKVETSRQNAHYNYLHLSLASISSTHVLKSLTLLLLTLL
jgi:hypothetical protein